MCCSAFDPFSIVYASRSEDKQTCSTGGGGNAEAVGVITGGLAGFLLETENT